MILTFAEDFTSAVVLDSVLTGIPESGDYYNRGVHPLVNLDNLLDLLPDQTYTFADYVAGTTYGKFETTQKRTDIVTSDSIVYESLITANAGNTPADNPTKWQVTNIESLRLKSFINLSKDNMKSALNLNRQLVDSQYLYNVGEDAVTPSGDYIGWAIEPKGSDYVKITINQIALQATTTDEVTMTVVNQGVVIDTIALTPVSGVLEFEDIGYTITGIGIFYFVIAACEVRSQTAFNDPLKYQGFTMYPVSGTGDTAEDADYSFASYGNGINFNISAYLDSSQYVTNNLIHYAKLLQAQFEIDFLRMAVTNANDQSNSSERNLSAVQVQRAYFETIDLESDTVARRYNYQLTKARRALDRTFDKFLQSDPDNEIEIEIGVQ